MSVIAINCMESMHHASFRSLLTVTAFHVGSTHALTATNHPSPASDPRDWSWSHLEETILPPTPPPRKIDYALSDEARTTRIQTTTLYRERNGWCIYSARLWLALELKGVEYETILLDASRYDTYDGGFDEDRPWPTELEGRSLPQLRFEGNLHCGSNEDSSLRLLRDLDEFFPTSPRPLFPPDRDAGMRGAPNEDDGTTRGAAARGSAEAFGTSASEHLGDARPSPRAAFLFRGEEGRRLDALPRPAFEAFLDAAESLLSADGGPFLGGSRDATAADVVWAPLLERYAAQLPCLHSGLRPRGDPRWPLLARWYGAMDGVPEYACLVRGDAPSWRKVLFVDPWWPPEDLWHSRDAVGPKGELKASEEECTRAFGGSGDDENILPNLWKDFVASRPYISPKGPSAEAAAVLVRNYGLIAKDAAYWINENYGGHSNPSLDNNAIHDALKAIALALFTMNDGESDGNYLWDMVGVAEVLAYLDHRICVPRDMGAHSAAAIRSLYHHSRTK